MFAFGLQLLNCHAAWKHKAVRGVSLLAVVGYTSWSVFNVYYFGTLGQAWSQMGNCFILVGNATWLGLALSYRRAS
jgi:hypothetical protein